MIRPEEIELLETPNVRDSIEANLEKDPLRVALDKGLDHASLVASQVKYLQRARTKLPSYFRARCIIPPRAFEQASSEATAAHKNYSGRSCIDLTCGLGVDSLYLSKTFDEVISVERDPSLAQIAAINFGRLGADNITVVNSTAEEFVALWVETGRRADMIYIDPDRRTEGNKRSIRFEECSPNVIELLPLLRTIARRIVIKASPLFDIEEAFRLFGPHCIAEAVSIGGECKELIIEISDDITVPMVRAWASGKGTVEFPLHRARQAEGEFTPPYKYMAVPDVALRKGRLTADYFGSTIPGAYVSPPDGYVFFNIPPEDHSDIPAKIFAIENMAPYNPKTLKKELRERGITKADIYLSNFPEGAASICRAVGIREGGGTKLAFTKAGKGLWSIELKDLPLHKQK